MVGAELEPGDIHEPGRFVPLTPAEMDAELYTIEAEEQGEKKARQQRVGELLRQVQQRRDEGDVAGVRQILMSVLELGDADQRMVARNILDQLD